MTPRPDLQEALRPYVPELLVRWPPGLSWQVLDGTLMSADISGFTALSERLARGGREGAEQLTALVNDCFAPMIESCARHGGDVVKFGGDALLVWFAGEAHALRACRAAIEMRRVFRTPRHTADGARAKLAVSIGVHTGEHAFFAVRNGHIELVVTGPGATATVDAEAEASAGEILLTPATATRVPPSWLGVARPGGVLLRRAVGHDDPPAVAAPAVDITTLVPSDQAEQIGAGAVNEHRQVTVAFVRFCGTDELVAAGALDVVQDRLQRTADLVWETCRQFGVSWLGSDVYHDGGKLVLTAGAPITRGNDEDRMLRAVRSVLDASDPGWLRAGVNRGFVFAGDLGGERRRAYTTMGDATNLAARLMSAAGPGELVASRAVLDWAGSAYEHEPMEPFLVKGKSAPVLASRVRAHAGPRDDLDRIDSELWGRTAEVEHLADAARRTESGHGDLVLLAGERGIGKSRLTLEVVRAFPHFRLAFTRCQPYDQFSPFSTLVPVLRELLGIDERADATTAGHQLRAWLLTHAPDLDPFAPLLAVGVGAELPATPESDDVAASFRRARTVQLVVEVLGRRATEPIVVVIDDVNVADEASREVLAALAESVGDHRLLVLVTSEPGDALGVHRLDVGPLDERAVEHLVEDALGDHAVPPAVVRSMIARSSGNPLFAKELVAAVVHDPDAAMPETLEALVAAQVDALEPEDRRLLRLASVLGSEVDIAVLGELAEDRVVRRPDRWERLTRFLDWSAPGVVRFRYDTYWRVVYGGLSFSARRRAHRRVVEVLETAASDDAALLAAHAHRAGDRERAWRYAVAAAERAVEQYMFGEASSLYEMAFENDAHVAVGERVEVAEAAGATCEQAGRFEAARRFLAVARRSFADAIDLARIDRRIGEVEERLGNYGAARRAYRRATMAWEKVPWHQGIAERTLLLTARAGLAYRQSRYDEAWTLGAAAMTQADLIGDQRAAAHAALVVSNVVMHLRWQGAVVQRIDVVDMFRRAGDREGEARMLNNVAVDAYFDGDWDTAERLYRELARLQAQMGGVIYEATALNNLGELLSDQGRDAEAAHAFRTASRSWRSVGYATGVALVESNLGRLAARRRELGEALEALGSAHGRFQALGAESFALDAELRMVEARVLAAVRPDERDPHVLAGADSVADTEPHLYVLAQRLDAAIAAREGDRQRAAAAGRRSVEKAEASGIVFEEALSLDLYARLVDGDEATAARARATEIFLRLGVVTPPVIPLEATVSPRTPTSA